MLAHEVSHELDDNHSTEVVIEDKSKGLYLKYDPNKLSFEELIELLKG
jgi:hypothetical protein